ncbi:ybl117 [Escherichia coli]|uniref:Ybl117 n=1 Tax=Escherichia coli TaxID=562 RepID=A0A376NUG7_ECOLX|nr:ybl117 [Escherichia coli]
MRWKKRDYPSRLGAEGPVNTPEGGYVIMEKLIEEQGCPQAFIASSLPVLEGAVRAIRDRLGAVPPEINIGTFDEHPCWDFSPTMSGQCSRMKMPGQKKRSK